MRDDGADLTTVTDDQRELTTTNGSYGIGGPSYHWLINGTTGKDTRALGKGTMTLGSVDRTLSVDGAFGDQRHVEKLWRLAVTSTIWPVC